MKSSRPSCDIVIPVYNEEKALKKNIQILKEFAEKYLQLYTCKIKIVDNGSTDNTLQICKDLIKHDSKIEFICLKERGRGRALKYAWSHSKADIMSYMDIDLSSNLSALPNLIKAIADGAHIAIGSRLLPDAYRKRCLSREILSRGYNLIVKSMFFSKFSDAQCGFKAISKEVAKKVLRYIKDEEWFFDSELLIVAEKLGFKIKEISVSWIEDIDSRVKIIPTVIGDLKGLIRVKKTSPWKLIKRD